MLFLFLVMALLAEVLIVLYAISLGVKDDSLLTKFLGTDWNLPLAISPLFHLVPLAGMLSLATSWIYLSKHVAARSYDAMKGKPAVIFKRRKPQKATASDKPVSSSKKAMPSVGGRPGTLRATISSALMILLVFLAFVFIVSLLAYPKLIYDTITNAYQNDPSLLGFVKGTGAALAPIGAAFWFVNNALLAIAPGFRDFAMSLGMALKPLADLDGAGKYLVLQNAAAWISASVALLKAYTPRKPVVMRMRRS